MMHSKWREWVLASGRLPTLVSAAPTMAYLPLMFDIESSEQNRWSDRVLVCPHRLQRSILFLLYPITTIFPISMTFIIRILQQIGWPITRYYGISRIGRKSAMVETDNYDWGWNVGYSRESLRQPIAIKERVRGKALENPPRDSGGLVSSATQGVPRSMTAPKSEMIAPTGNRSCLPARRAISRPNAMRAAAT